MVQNMKRNSRQTIGVLRQIIDCREEEHPSSRWDSWIQEPAGLTCEELRYKAWDAIEKGDMRPEEFAEQYRVSASFVRKWHRIIEAGHELFRRDHHGFTLKFISKSVTIRPKRIKEALGLDSSITVIDRVLMDKGLTKRRAKKKKPFYSRYESDRALDMIQLDYKQWNDRTWSIFAVDDGSHTILGLELTKSATTDVAISWSKASSSASTSRSAS